MQIEADLDKHIRQCPRPIDECELCTAAKKDYVRKLLGVRREEPPRPLWVRLYWWYIEQRLRLSKRLYGRNKVSRAYFLRLLSEREHARMMQALEEKIAETTDMNERKT